MKPKIIGITSWGGKKPQNKYKNIFSAYNGIVYDSKREMQYAQELDLRKKAKDIKDWERQVVFPIEVNGKPICRYVADFVVTPIKGKKQIVEIKGVFLAAARLKMKLMKVLYGQKYDIIILR